MRPAPGGAGAATSLLCAFNPMWKDSIANAVLQPRDGVERDSGVGGSPWVLGGFFYLLTRRSGLRELLCSDGVAVMGTCSLRKVLFLGSSLFCS